MPIRLITKLVVTFAAISAAILIIGGGLAALVGGVVFLGGLVGISGAAAFTLTLVGAAIAGIGAAILTFGPLIKSGLGSVLGWIESNWKNALLVALTGPFGIALLGIKHFFPQFFDAGVNLLKQLGAGIESALAYPVKAIGEVAAKIRAHLPFSPAKEGPLADHHRNRRDRRRSRESIRPEPVTAAVRRALASVGSFELGALRGIAAAVLPLALNMTSVSPTFHGGAGVLPKPGAHVNRHHLHDQHLGRRAPRLCIGKKRRPGGGRRGLRGSERRVERKIPGPSRMPVNILGLPGAGLAASRRVLGPGYL